MTKVRFEDCFLSKHRTKTFLHSRILLFNRFSLEARVLPRCSLKRAFPAALAWLIIRVTNVQSGNSKFLFNYSIYLSILRSSESNDMSVRVTCLLICLASFRFTCLSSFAERTRNNCICTEECTILVYK